MKYHEIKIDEASDPGYHATANWVNFIEFLWSHSPCALRLAAFGQLQSANGSSGQTYRKTRQMKVTNIWLPPRHVRRTHCCAAFLWYIGPSMGFRRLFSLILRHRILLGESKGRGLTHLNGSWLTEKTGWGVVQTSRRPVLARHSHLTNVMPNVSLKVLPSCFGEMKGFKHFKRLKCAAKASAFYSLEPKTLQLDAMSWSNIKRTEKL